MRIVHIFRTPVGGLFRHVRDLVRGQSDDGHQVGVICDSSTGGEQASKLLDAIASRCELGIHRFPVSRLPGLGDIAAIGKSRNLLSILKPDIVHGHGAKGGLYGRLGARLLNVPSVYTPHGGSLHFEWSSLGGAVFLSAEVLERKIGDGLLFVCDFERKAFDQKVGVAGKPNAVVHNGLWPEEFKHIESDPQATDLLYIGELRKLKGTDVLIDALALLKSTRPVTATIVGDGEDRSEFETMTKEKGLADSIRFCGPMPARQAFPKGRILIMPSRAESFPYIVLEALAAGIPMLASRVGGIPEIMPEPLLVEPGSPPEWAEAIKNALGEPKRLHAQAMDLSRDIENRFSASKMVEKISSFYQSLIQR